MGVRGLGTVIDQYAPDAITQVVIGDLANRVLAFDVSHLIYKYSISIRNSGKDIVNNSGKNVNHLQALYNTIYSCIRNSILPVFVSDGKPGDFKRATIEERKAKQVNAIRMYNALDGTMTTDKIKYFKRSFSIEPHMFRECKFLSQITGVSYVVAPNEADPQCASLARSVDSNVWGVVSDDWDMLLFGAPFLIRGFTTRKDKKIDVISLNVLLDRMKLTHCEFIDVCILLGTDYNEIEFNGTQRVFKIKGLTNKKVYNKYIQYQRNIRQLINGLRTENQALINAGKQPEYNIPADYIEGFDKIKAYINDMKVAIPKQIKTDWKEPDATKIEQFMCDENSFSKKIVKQQARTLFTKYNSAYIGPKKHPTTPKFHRQRQHRKYNAHSGIVSKKPHYSH
jgi:flap endonuclease-1